MFVFPPPFRLSPSMSNDAIPPRPDSPTELTCPSESDYSSDSDPMEDIGSDYQPSESESDEECVPYVIVIALLTTYIFI